MSNYGQYCPLAKSLEILGDGWSLLIIRHMLTGTTHFNDLERVCPKSQGRFWRADCGNCNKRG
jgi:DNA-binding HxlR family transcriptional regulator